MKLEHDGKWKFTDDNGEISRPLANTIASKFNRLDGENARLKREIASRKEELAHLKQGLVDDSSSATARFKMDLTSFVIGALAVLVGVLAVVFNEEITSFVSDIMSTELTVGGLIVAAVIALIIIVILLLISGQMKAGGDGQMANRLKVYGRNNQESSDSDQSSPSSRWAQIKSRVRTSTGFDKQEVKK